MRRTLLIGALALAIGLLVYLTDRATGHAQWLPAMPGWAASGSFGSFGAIGAWLPSLAHVLGFSLLSAAWLPPPAHPAACASWCVIDLGFECGQHASVAPLLAAWLAQWSPGLPGAEALQRYFLRGRFDPLDLLACIAGAGLALMILRWPRRPHSGDGHAP